MKLASLVVGAALAAAAGVDEEDFRWERELAAAAPGHVTLEPDGPMYAHSRVELADLRVLDAGGRQVPWRRLPNPAPRAVKEVALLNAGRQGRAFVGLLDLGPARAVRNRAELVMPDVSGYVARVTVFGSDDRRTFTRLSTTTVFDLRGASAARSTTLVFPPTDHRFLRLRGPGLPAPLAVRVYNAPARPRLVALSAAISREERNRSTQITLDLRYERRPVDVLRFTTATRRFDRPVVVSGSNGSDAFAVLASSRLVRLGGAVQSEVRLDARHRRLRISVENGDDAPLGSLHVVPLARPRTIVLSRGFDPPFRLLYGSRSLTAPDYDFARVPARELRPLVAGQLGAERPNPQWQAPEDTRSFLERNPRLVEAALALVALGLGVGGFLALRRRA